MSGESKIISCLDLDGKVKPLTKVAAAHGISSGMLYGRMKRSVGKAAMQSGKTITITESMVSGDSGPRYQPFIIDGIEYKTSVEAWQANKWISSPKTLRNRCRVLGTKNITKEQYLSHSTPNRRLWSEEAKKKRRESLSGTEPFLVLPINKRFYASEIDKIYNVSASTLNRLKKLGKTTFTEKELAEMKRGNYEEKLKNGLEVYSDPKFLPEIPHGDLAHLSGRKNTGAARSKDADHWDKLNAGFSREPMSYARFSI